MKVNELTFFDLETTGLDVNNNKIVSVFCENKKKKWHLNTITNPEIEIPKEASDVHGITNEIAKNFPANNLVLKGLVSIFDDTKIISGYNILKFDMPVVINLCKFYNIDIDFKSYQYVDVYNLLKIVLFDEDLKKIGSLRLSNVYEYITGKKLDNAHDAFADVTATKTILNWIIKNYDISDCGLLSYEYISGVPVSKDYKFFTGKHAEKTVSELIIQDKKYLKFLESKNLICFDDSVTL